MSNTLKGHFISDLHLFAQRSTAFDLAPRIREAVGKSHTLVLGGDIFDFKWSTFSSMDRSIDEAIGWLDELIGSFPKCTFHYLLGNHDALPRFVSALDRLALCQPRLQWQPYVLRIEDCVFLHGDVVDGSPNNTDLEERRKLCGTKPSPRPYMHWFYDMAVHARLHRLAMHVVIRQKGVLRKLTRYLSDEGLCSQNGVRHVYFGHTHRIVDGLQYGGLSFHNGGASIKGLPFRIIETRLPFERNSTASQGS